MPADKPVNSAGLALPLAQGVRVLSESAGLVALYKPEGLRAHPNQSGSIDKGALLAAPYDLARECYTLPDRRDVFLLHRLDAPTSGLLLLCADAALAAKVRDLFARHMVRKTYEALVFGDAGRGKRTWRDRLRTEKGAGRTGARTSVGAGDMAETQVGVIRRGESRNGIPLSLLSLEPATGRTHQLRVQCASRHLPIVGDATYGNFPCNRKAAGELGIKRLCLHAAVLNLEVEHGGRKITFSAKCPTPDIFREAIA